MTTTHADCTHAATKAGRAACRRALNVPTVQVAPRADKPAAIDYSTMRYDFDRVTCMRCAGKGTYPSAAWNGVCLGCKGSGKVLTRLGKAARKVEQEYIEANLMIPARDVKPGMKIRPNQVDGWKTVVTIDDEPKVNGYYVTKGDEGNEVRTPIEYVVITTQKTTSQLEPTHLVQRAATPDEYTELVTLLARRKGAILSPKQA